MSGTERHGLGRLVAIDERDKAYPLRALVAPPAVRRVFRYYACGPVLNQGPTSSCVGHAWRGFLDAAPLMTRGGPDAFEIYRYAQLADEWEGEDYEGTSVRAGAKVLQAMGLASYHWAETAEDVADFLLSDAGSCVGAGTIWTEAMVTPDARGFVRYEGGIVGGHAWLITGYNRARGVFRARNSWGTGWGRRGDMFLSGETFERILADNGECCAATERRVI